MKCSILKNSSPVHCSPIERLPTEILEMIFFNCLNLSLPRASLILGVILSSFFVKARLFEMVFSGYDWTRTLTHAGYLKHVFCHARNWKDEVRSLQNGLLKSRWVKADFFRRYIPIYLEKTIIALSENKVLPIYIRKPLPKTYLQELPRLKMNDRQLHLIAPSINRHEVFARLIRKQITLLDVEPQLENDETAQIHVVEHNKFSFLLDPGQEWSMSEEGDESARYAEATPENLIMINCLQGCHIPAKLLGGPWTADRYHLFTMLSAAGATINEEDPIDREIALRGFFEALKVREVRIIRFLLRSLRPGQEYLLYAALYLDCPKAIMESMIRRGQWYWRKIHHDAINAWAEELDEDGDERGWQIMDIMDRYPAHCHLYECEKWVYIRPEDPDTSPGSFKPVCPGIYVGEPPLFPATQNYCEYIFNSGY